MLKKLLLTAATAALLSTAAYADEIIHISSDGNAIDPDEEWFQNPSLGGGNGNTVLITNPHPAWQPNANQIGNWVSYDAGTGSPTTTATPNVPTHHIDDFSYYFVDYFTTTQAGKLSFDLKVWSDDTAAFYLISPSAIIPAFIPATNGAITPNFTQGTCAQGALGCEPNEYAEYIFTTSEVYQPGTYLMAFRTYQIGGGPFGLLYDGNITVAPSPALTGMILGGLGLLGFSALRRKK